MSHFELNNWTNTIHPDVASVFESVDKIDKEKVKDEPKKKLTDPRIYTIPKQSKIECVCNRSNSPSEKQAWQILTETSNEEADEFLQNLFEEKYPEWVFPIEATLPPIPQSLRKFIKETLKYGVEHSSHEWLEDKITIPPSTISQYVSGSDKAQRFKDSNLGSYFASLFHIIQLSSCTEVELVGWDLYHGHVFLHTKQIQNENDAKDDLTLQSDFGILFHSKEFPKEYGPSKYNPIYPIGHKKQGGEKDPRHGTKVSIQDSDFHLRNYIWLSSTNKIYLLDPTSANFDKRLLCNFGGDTFQTCSWKYFTSNPLGDINYFPSIFTNEDIGPYYHNTVEKILLLTSKHKENGISPKEIFHSKFHDKNQMVSWYIEQIGRFIRHSSSFSKDLFFCPFLGFPTILRLYDAFIHNNSDIGDVLCKIEEHVLNDILQVIEYVRNDKKQFRFVCEEKVIQIDNLTVLRAIEDRKLEIISKREEYNANQRDELLKKCVDEEHANLALQLTAYQGLFSSYKSYNLLSASFVKYRSEEDIKEYGEENYDLNYVFKVMKHTFYSWSTLYALQLQKHDGLSMKESIRIAQKASHDKLHQSLQKSLDDYDPVKEAEYYAKKEAEKMAKEQEEVEHAAVEQNNEVQLRNEVEDSCKQFAANTEDICEIELTQSLSTN